MEAELTDLMRAAGEGDKSANDRLVELVYGTLRNIARARMARMRPGHTITPTDLVNEAYGRLLEVNFFADPRNRRYFFGAVARAMSQILYEYEAKRRGVKVWRMAMEDADKYLTSTDRRLDLLALKDALEALQEVSEDQYEVIQLRFWAGCTMPEIAGMMDVCLSKVEKDYYRARAFLYGRLNSRDEDATCVGR